MRSPRTLVFLISRVTLFCNLLDGKLAVEKAINARVI